MGEGGQDSGHSRSSLSPPPRRQHTISFANTETWAGDRAGPSCSLPVGLQGQAEEAAAASPRPQALPARALQGPRLA